MAYTADLSSVPEPDITETLLTGVLDRLLGEPEPKSVELPNRSWLELLATYRRLFAEFSDDAATFFSRRGRVLEDVLIQLEVRWDDRRTLRLSEIGACGCALLFAHGITASARYAVEGRPDLDAQDELAQKMDEILRHPAVRSMFLAFYRPRVSRRERESWRGVDWTSLRFHRVGTTSMILRARRRPGPGDVAVKFVHFMFQQIEPIRYATRNYASKTESLREKCPQLTEVVGSSDSWIIEEFIHGRTLAEFVQEFELREMSYKDRMALFRRCYIPLVDAVISLHDAGTIHGDLSPSNVLVQHAGSTPSRPQDIARDEGLEVIRLIDVGRNLLASSTIGRVRSAEAHFVAPEVVALAPGDDAVGTLADLYSLGLLIPLCLGLAEPAEIHDTQLPPSLFKFEPLLADVCIDLADHQPEGRLSAFRRDVDDPSAGLPQLRSYLADLTAGLEGRQPMAMELSTHDAKLASSAFRLAVGELASILTSLTRSAKSDPLSRWRNHSRLIGYWRWSVVALAAFLLSMLAIGMSLAVDYPDVFGELPYYQSWRSFLVDSLGVSESTSLKWEARMVGFSFALCVYAVYIYALSRLTFLNAAPGLLGRSSELAMRTISFVGLPFIVLGTLWFPAMWIWYGVLGMLLIAVHNSLTFVIDRRVEQQREREAAAGRLELTHGYWQSLQRSEIARYWAPSMFLYVAVVLIIASATTWFGADDTFVYAIALSLVNLVFFFWAQSVRQGPKLRFELTRNSLLGSRLANDYS